ncbi:MAG: hypothetical protein H6737_04710 [Alphaproteobacteria bacterium]|nr:hypothetical protein [Alphaproteobacteria bacterium]
MLVILFAGSLADEPSIHAHMQLHLDTTVRARDAVVRGDFDAARSELKALAEHAPLKRVPPDARKYVGAMQAAAKSGAKAKTLEAVGASVAEVGLQCGGCHAALGRGPVFADAPEPPAGDDVAAHMARHAWASARMWEGLVQPADDRWDGGALQLLEEPWTKARDPDVDPAVAVFAERIHTAGVDALMKSSDTERAGLYGALIATCARCHRAVDDGAAD